MRTIPVAMLDEQGQRQRQEVKAYQVSFMANPLFGQRTPYPDSISRVYYFRHGMLPLSTGLREKLQWAYTLEDDEREGGHRHVNPTLLCPYSGAVLDLEGPFAVWRSVFEERQKHAPPGGDLDKESADERDSSVATREPAFRPNAPGEGGCALEAIAMALQFWLASFAASLHYPCALGALTARLPGIAPLEPP